jgi:hypothetical protein
MARPKKEGKHVTMLIDKRIVTMWEQYAKEMGQTKTMAMERIMGEYLEKYFKKKKTRKNMEE